MCDAIIPSTSMPTMAANLLSEVEVIFDRFELNIDYFLRIYGHFRGWDRAGRSLRLVRLQPSRWVSHK